MTLSVVQLDSTIYERSAVEEAVAAYAAFATAYVLPHAGEELTVEIRSESPTVVDDFLNFALMASLERLLASF